ncbi:hypothetical protein D3C81_1900890 [compost metagenome]
MAAARGVAVGQFVDQRQLRRSLEQAVQINLFEQHPTVLRAQQRLLHKACEQGFGFRPTMGLHHGRQHPDALLLLAMGCLQHRVRLAHPGGSAEKDLKAPTTLAGQFSKQRIGASGLAHGQYSGSRAGRRQPIQCSV